MSNWPTGDGEMARLIRAHDWASTPLGQIASWPQSLKTIVDLMLSSLNMMSLVWGDEAIHLYNDGFADLLHEHRTLSLGRSAFDTFARSRDVFADDIAQGMLGRSARLLEQRYPVLRNGALAEAWFDVDYVPVRSEAGAVKGVLWTLKEVTGRRLAERALRESEARHRLLIGSWAQAVWEVDADGVVVADSPSWRAYTGQTFEEWRGFGWLDAVHPDDRAYAERQWREAVAARTRVDAEFRLKAPDGGWRWTNVCAAPVSDSDGRVEKWLGLNIDIDSRKEAEAALRESKERLKLALQATGIATYEWNLLSDRLIVNERFREMIWMGSDEPVVGAHVMERCVHPADRPRIDPQLARAMGPGSDGKFSFEHRLNRVGPLGEPWMLSHGQVYFTEHNGGRRPFQVFGTLQDITERKRADQALRDSEERQTFLLKISDAVRPLAGPADIQGETTRLLREQLDAGWCYYVDWNLDRKIGLVLRDSASDGLPSLAGAHDVSDASEFLELLADGAVRVVRDYANYEELPAHIRQKFVGLGFRSMMMAPLVKEGRLIATMIVGDTEVRNWSGNETSFLVEAAERTWAAVERARAEAALRDSEQALATDLANAERLRSLSERLVSEESFEAIYDEVLSAIVAIAQADAGTIQNYDPGTKTLELIASLNFSRRITDHFHRVDTGSRTACGQALRTGECTFVDFPDDVADLGCQLLVDAGFQAAVAVPLLSRSGAPLGMLNAHWRSPRHRPSERVLRFLGLLARQVADLIEQRRAQSALRKSEERLRQFGEASQDILWIRDADTLQWTYLTPAFDTVYGLSREEALAGDNYRGWQDVILPEDRARAVASIGRVRAGEQVTFEYRIRRPSDGQMRWLRDTDFPMRDDTGRVVRIGGVGHDVTALKAIEAALIHSEGQLRDLVEGVSQLVWRAVDGGDWIWASPQWTAFTGQAEPDAHRRGWLEPIHPDDRPVALAAWAQAQETARGFEVEYRIRNAATRAYRWFQTRAVPRLDARGEAGEWLGTSTDVHQLKALQESQAVMVAELQHRTRNLIAVVRGIADDTMEQTGPTEAFRAAFDDRLTALSRVQGLLSRAEAEPITIAAVVRLELDALGAATAGDRIVTGGPDVWLRNSTVQTLALALHELATNARKYGALSHERGRLVVTWSERSEGGERRLILDWIETGLEHAANTVQPVSEGGGYGRELIERALPHALGARTSYTLGETGVRCTIDLPARQDVQRGGTG